MQLLGQGPQVLAVPADRDRLVRVLCLAKEDDQAIVKGLAIGADSILLQTFGLNEAC